MNTNHLRFRMIVATSLDGKIAHDNSHQSSWTSQEDKTFLHERLNESDAIIIGRTTYEHAQNMLMKRRCIVFSHQSLSLPSHHECIDPQTTDLMAFLIERDCSLIDVLGGTAVYSYFLEKNLADDLYITIEPILFGQGLPFFASTKKLFRSYHLASVTQLNARGTILIHYIAAPCQS